MSASSYGCVSTPPGWIRSAPEAIAIARLRQMIAEDVVIVAQGGQPDDEPAPEISYEQSGRAYIRQVLHQDGILKMVNDVLGPTIELGPPIGAGPGRKAATVTVLGTF